MNIEKLRKITATAGIVAGLTFIGLVLFMINAHAASPCDEMVPYGYPTTGPGNTTMLCRIAYVVEFDTDKKLPRYSAELLLIENIPNKVKRDNGFYPTPELQRGQRIERSDYENQSEGEGMPKFDRGHMTPYEDARKNTAAAKQTNDLSNTVPQEYHFNRGLWRSIENRTRNWAGNQPEGLHVITGPQLTGYTRYIGNHVPVPTYLFKVLIDKQTNQGIAYYVPNVAPFAGQKPEQYKVTISYVETMTGYNFTPLLLDITKATLLKGSVGAEFK